MRAFPALRAAPRASCGGGVSPDLLEKVEGIRPDAVLSDKAREGGEVSLRDRLPSLVGFALGLVLWSAVLTGASILLNSVMEEKSNRVLEILAASATTVELMGGKILGVACLALTLLGVWGLLGFAALITGAPGLAADLRSVLRGGLPPTCALRGAGLLMYAAALTP